MNKKIAVILFVAAMAQGCSWSIGKTESSDVTAHTTLGEELISLKEALDSGAITEGEYEDLVEKMTTARTSQQ